MLDGKRLDITTSLRDSLWQARDAYEPVALWADAICINQDDNQEKNGQVALMGRIYQTAQRVLICLGLDPEDLRSASEAASFIAEVEILMDEVFEDPNFSWDWDSFPWPFEDDPILTDERWDSFAQLDAQPWFERGWVVQEAALGRDPLVLWAGEEIRFNSFLRVHLWRYLRASVLNPELDFAGLSNILQHSYVVQHPEEAQTFWTPESRNRVEPMPPLEILQDARTLKLTDPKDRIYAFMSLKGFEGTTLTLQPNYGSDVSHLDVYKDFAIKYLEITTDLDILNFVQHDEENIVRPFPSWVPRWDFGYNGGGGDMATLAAATEKKITLIESKHDSRIDFSIHSIDGSSALQVRAVTLGSVQYVSEAIEIPLAEETQEGVRRVVSLWRDLALQLKKYPESPYDNPSLSFLVALNAGHYSGVWDEYYDKLHEFARLLQSDLPSQNAAAYSQNVTTQSIVQTFSQSSGQRFALLGRGYFGLCPNITRKGDLCTVVSGTRLPFILRGVPGKPGQYRVVGPAFILSKKVRPSNGTPYRLAETKSSEDWKDWGLKIEDITLV
jgi:hypothetical protein